MKKIFLSTVTLLLVICFTASTSKAQLKRFSLGPYAEVGFPTGDFSETHKTGYGVGLNADIKLVAGLSATGSVGYMRFGGKEQTLPTGGTFKAPALGAIPVRVGLKYKFLPLFYFKLQSGVANFTGDYDGSAVILQPGIGLRLLGLDVEAKYEAWFKDGTTGFWGLKAGYNF